MKERTLQKIRTVAAGMCFVAGFISAGSEVFMPYSQIIGIVIFVCMIPLMSFME